MKTALALSQNHSPLLQQNYSLSSPQQNLVWKSDTFILTLLASWRPIQCKHLAMHWQLKCLLYMWIHDYHHGEFNFTRWKQRKAIASSGHKSHSWFELPALHDLWNKGHRVPATEESNSLQWSRIKPLVWVAGALWPLDNHILSQFFTCTGCLVATRFDSWRLLTFCFFFWFTSNWAKMFHAFTLVSILLYLHG